MKEHIQQAHHFLEQGYVDQAQLVLQDALQAAASDQERGELSLAYGRLLLMLGDLKGALERCRQAVKLLPDDPRAHYTLGLAYRQQEQWALALESFEQTDRLKPDDPAVLANRGMMLFHHTEGQDGQPLLIRALRLDLTRHETLLDLAYIYTAEGNLPAALACSMHAYQISQGDPEAEEAIGSIQELQWRFGDGPEVHEARRVIPRRKEEWRRWIATVSSPLDLIKTLAEHTEFDSQQALEALAERAFDEWNQAPRPELGGLTPEQASKKKPRPSTLEERWSYPWLNLDNRLAENNPVRRDMVAFLKHLDESSYKATASLGNLPLKGVRAVNDLLTHPVSLEGDEVNSAVRLVSDVWEIFFLQGMAIMVDLAVFKPGKRITLTDKGHTFLQASPARQLWLVLHTWWWVANWQMAYDWQVFEEFEQSGLPIVAMRVLRSLPVGKRIRVDDFIESLAGMIPPHIMQGGLIVWKSAVTVMILNVLADFEIITVKKKPKKLDGIRIDETVWFKLTPFGGGTTSCHLIRAERFWVSGPAREDGAGGSSPQTRDKTRPFHPMT